SGATSERRSSCGGGMASYSLYSSGWTGDASASGTGSCATAAHAHAQKSAAAAARLTPLLGRYVFMSLFRPGAVFLAYDLPDTDVQHIGDNHHLSARQGQPVDVDVRHFPGLPVERDDRPAPEPQDLPHGHRALAQVRGKG